VPKGGPDGGDGGRGADVVLVCDGSLRDLQAFRRRAHFKGGRGGHGEGGERHGASPAALEVPVPPGTVVEDADGTVRFDLTEPGQRAVVAQGGAGGRGNKRFTNSTRQAPRFAEKGLPGEERWLELRLRLLADVGLVGLPNAGKSSLLGRLTRAAPKVADYPFTTLEPVLGTLEAPDRQLVVADIPGLIEGASSGAGLGHEFLAHIERTRVLVHVLDLAPLDGSDPVENYATVERELARYGHGLAELPRMIALSKADLAPAEKAAHAADEWRTRAPDVLSVTVTSAATGQGLDELARELMRQVQEGGTSPDPADEPAAEHKVYRPADDAGYRVERGPGGVLRVVGPAVDRLLARHDIENEEALRYVEERLRKMGVIQALEQAGFKPGDDVELAGTVFELDPGAPF
jgi:GTP-binding protein